MDRENVITNIEQQIRWIEEIECHKFPGWLNVTNAMRDAIAMLKEREAKIPSIMQNVDGIWSTCPTCGNKLHAILAIEMNTYFPKYCQECGQAVKWG